MKDKIEQLGAISIATLLFIWNLPIILIVGGGAFIFWLLFDLPKRKQRHQAFTDEVLHWRQHKQKVAYLAYSRNHPFSEWLEEHFIPKYKKNLIAPKYITSDVIISDELCMELYERAEHGGDDTYAEASEEDDDVSALFVFNSDGSVTKWTPPMVDEDRVNTRKARALYEKVMKEAMADDGKVREASSASRASFWQQVSYDVETYNFDENPNAGRWQRLLYFINSRPWLAWPLVIAEIAVGVWIMYYWWLSPATSHFWWEILLGFAGLLLVVEGFADVFLRIKRIRRH